jgi:hypothetical protein
LGKERDQFKAEGDSLRNELYTVANERYLLKSRLEKYEPPAPKTFWKQIQVDANGVPVASENGSEGI